MKVNRIPLKERENRIRKGSASDPQFVIHAVQSLAAIPFCDYMTVFEEEKEQLQVLLSISEKEEAKMTYQDIAKRIGQRMSSTAAEHEKENAIEAMKLLVLPFQRYYAEQQRERNRNL